MGKPKRKRKFQKVLEGRLPIELNPPVTLLQRMESGMAKAGLDNRNDLIYTLMDRWCMERGC